MCVCVCARVSVDALPCGCVSEFKGGARKQASHTMQGLAPAVATSPLDQSSLSPRHKDHSVARPARGFHSGIQREGRGVGK